MCSDVEVMMLISGDGEETRRKKKKEKDERRKGRSCKMERKTRDVFFGAAGVDAFLFCWSPGSVGRSRVRLVAGAGVGEGEEGMDGNKGGGGRVM